MSCLQVIKGWAANRWHTRGGLPARPDSFLERVAMGGDGKQGSGGEKRSSKISDIK
jgi:hypothetical protein